MDAFVCRLAPSKKQELDRLLARAIYVTGAPFSLVGDPHWKEFLNVLNPAYDPPSPYLIGNRLLQEESDLVSTFVKGRLEEVTEPSFTLTADGWTNPGHNSVINFCVCEPKAMFVGSRLANVAHDKEFIVEVLTDKLNEVGPGKILGICTDNAANMKSAWEDIMKRYRHIVCYGCTAHGLNLLMHDFMGFPSMIGVQNSAVKIVKTINYRAQIKGLFEASGSVESLKVAVETRWYSWAACFKSLLANRNAIETVVLSREESVKAKVVQIKKDVLNDIFWDRIAATCRVIELVSYYITVVERDTVPSLSVVPYLLNDLKKALLGPEGLIRQTPLLAAEEVRFEAKLEERIKFILGNSNVHYAAAIMDPHLMAREMTEDEVLRGCQWHYDQLELFPSVTKTEFASLFSQFRTRSGIFSYSFLWESVAKMDDPLTTVLEKRDSVPPLTWWEAYFNTNPLGKIAKRVLRLVPSSASVERVNSTHLRVHTRERNRLLHSRVEKLLNVAVNRRLEKKTSQGRHGYLPLPPNTAELDSEHEDNCA
jgi:hypothetical protein